jgi:hypothetical protein
MHFVTSAGSDYEALEPIVKFEQAKRAMEIVMGVADRREVTMRERGWCLWAIGGWKVGWVSSMSVRPLWCILARCLRARNFRNDNVLIMDYGIRDIRPSPRMVCPKKRYDDLLTVNTECSYMHAM